MAVSDSLQISLFEGSNSSALVIGDDVRQAVTDLSKAEISKSHGSVFTKPEVVDFMLDLIGYRSSHQLIEKRILEPSFGGGEFLLKIIERLLSSLTPESIVERYECLKKCICAVELHRETYLATKTEVILLLSKRLSPESSQELASEWLKQGDFLLEALNQDFDYVIGNPPYVRQESIPASLLCEYKLRYSTIYDRADLYIPFIEHSLSLLNTSGTLGFICSDRWMKNKYGGPLREFVARDFHLSTYVDMVDTDAFTQEVSAYPAITIFDRSEKNLTSLVERPKITPANLSRTSHAIATANTNSGLFRHAQIQGSDNAPWLIQAGDEIQLLRRLEGSFPTIEEAKCRIGIGVATGADHCFIAPYSELDIEDDRKIPLVTTKDIKNGNVKWQGMGVVNPFTAEGSLVNLEDYPKLKRYFSTHEKAIKARHCAKKNPDRWYRTIDRIWPDLTKQHKLLIPDIKGSAHIVYEDGKLYPHHNLYYLTSSEWDLHAVQAVLLSSVTKLFISSYSTKMRGGYLRFQAQYLRRLRLPHWQDVSTSIRKELIVAGRTRDLRACNEAISALYGITEEEHLILKKFNQ